MFDWNVNAVAIQLRPRVKLPTPNAQPRASALHSDGARSIDQSRKAKAAMVSGHRLHGSNPQALTRPARKQSSRDFTTPLCGGWPRFSIGPKECL